MSQPSNPDVIIMESINTHGIRVVLKKTREEFKGMCPTLEDFQCEMEMLVYGVIRAYRNEETTVRMVGKVGRDIVWFSETETPSPVANTVFDFKADITWTALNGEVRQFVDAHWPILDQVKEIRATQGMLRHFRNVDFVPVDAPGPLPNPSNQPR